VERTLLQDIPALVAALTAEGLTSAEVCAAQPACCNLQAAHIGIA
jgi:hypothetical protein